MASIDDYAAEQKAMENLRARHVADAFKTAAGDAWTPPEIDKLVGHLDLSRFITAGGEVDKAKVAALMSSVQSLGNKPAGTGKKAAASGADLYDRVHPKPGERGRAAAERRGFGGQS